MAEPTPSPSSSEDTATKPKLVAVEPRQEPAPRAQPPSAAPDAARTQRRSNVLPWALLVLLLLAAGALLLQSQRLTAMGERNVALSEQVQALEVQLSAATLEIQTYEMRQDLIRNLTSDLAERVGQLQALVEPGPAPEPFETP